MPAYPHVSVICLCYNHERYVIEAMESVLGQTYPDVELIVVDDASSDGSVAVINDFVRGNPHVRFISLSENAGICQAFNRALETARGDYVIDLAADDVLLPHRVARGVEVLEAAGPRVGVHFGNALYIDAAGRHLYTHADRFPHHTVPQGDIYKDLIRRHFICPPTMMFTRRVIEFLNGYDESLLYEDFDFWIRSSREFHFVYTPEVLVKKRLLPGSMSEKQFRPFSKHQLTTYKVCKKIFRLNRTQEERRALSARLAYEIRCAVRLLNFRLAFSFVTLYFKNLGRKIRRTV